MPAPTTTDGGAHPLRVDDLAWAPPEWTCCGFPLPGPGCEEISLEQALETLHRLADTTTDWDGTALGPAMHVSHMLVSRQGADGRWPARLNARTGEFLGDARTDAPLALYRRLAVVLDSTEFDDIIAYAEKRRAERT
jgi:hypothetical protein